MHHYYHIALQLILSSSEVAVHRSSRKADAASRALTVFLPEGGFSPRLGCFYTSQDNKAVNNVPLVPLKGLSQTNATHVLV